jgi:hypothetical protein
MIVSQKDGWKEHVITYINKGFSTKYKCFHPVEGECYALICGTMHFRRYIYKNHFTLKMNHKLLEWLTTMLDVYARQGMWIDML